MPRPSKQRVLIALRSFRSVAAAARSMRCNQEMLSRMISEDDDLADAKRKMDRVDVGALRVLHQRNPGRHEVRASDEKKAKKRGYQIGRNPVSAVALMHKRINDRERRERFATRKAAIDSVDAMMSTPTSAPQVATHDTPDRYCNNCETERCDDPCEVCCCHTVEVSDV